MFDSENCEKEIPKAIIPKNMVYSYPNPPSRLDYMWPYNQSMETNYIQNPQLINTSFRNQLSTQIPIFIYPFSIQITREFL